MREGRGVISKLFFKTAVIASMLSLSSFPQPTVSQEIMNPHKVSKETQDPNVRKVCFLELVLQ